MRTDTERLDALEAMTTGTIVCRESMRGRGWRLHNCSRQESIDLHLMFGIDDSANIRTAIDMYLDGKAQA